MQFIAGAIVMLVGVFIGAYLTQRTQQGKPIVEMPKKLHKIIPAKYDELMDDE